MKYANKRWQPEVAALTLLLFVVQGPFAAHAQTVMKADVSLALKVLTSVAPYVDPERGMTADEAVAYALEHNGDLLAARKEIDAARAMV